MAIFDKILVAYDGSKYSERALEKAKELIDLDPEIEAHIINITAVGHSGLYNLYGVDLSKTVFEEVEEKNKKVIINAQELMEDYKDNCTFTQIEGNISPTVIQYAAKHDIDLIILGSRGLGAFQGMLLGSVSQHVLQNTDRHVLVIR